MALPLSLKGFFTDLRNQAFLGIHFLQAPVFFFPLFHALHQGRVHTALLSLPFVKRRDTHTVFTAEGWHGLAAFCFL
jgi:hypothetical protein